MKFNSIFGLSQRALSALRLAAVTSVVSVLVACGGGGYTSTAPSPEAVFIKSPRALPAEYLARKAVSYGPYRTANRDTEVITAAMVKEDLDLLIQGNFKLIRLFNSYDNDAKLILDVIVDNNLDMKVQLGAYVYPTKYKNEPGWVIENNPYKVLAIEASNQAELGRTIALANHAKYTNTILTVSVGNETLVQWTSVPQDADKLAEYIKKVRDAVRQPVTTDDNFLAFRNPAPKPVLNQIDFAAIHMYPNIDTQFPNGDLYWDWKQLSVPAGPARAKAMMDASLVELRRQYAMVRVALDSMGLQAMPIAITETGWKAFDSEAPKQAKRAHPVNQKMFYSRLDTLRAEGRVGPGPANIFYFEAFDEPWKGGDDAWGLFDVSRKPRYVIQNLYPSAIWANPALTDADAVFFAPPTVNAAITTPRHTMYSDALGAALAPGLRVDAFDGNSVSAPEVTTAAAPEGVKSIEITPQPKDYGWGLLWQPITAGVTNNLSEFGVAGNLNLSVKTTYAGKIEIGFSTLDSEGNSQEVYLQIGSGDYGYCNTGAWCAVSIPLQAFKTKNSKIDFSLVANPFIIADRYAFTGKPLNSGITTKLNIDGIYWSR